MSRPSLLMVLAALYLVAACDQVKPLEARDTIERDARVAALEQPIGRFVVAGKREYPNGSEVYVLDTKSGQVCYYFVASGRGDDSAQKTDMRNCAGDPLVPE